MSTLRPGTAERAGMSRSGLYPAAILERVEYVSRVPQSPLDGLIDLYYLEGTH